MNRIENWDAYSQSYKRWKEEHPGKEFWDIWGKWRNNDPPLFHKLSQYDQEEIVIAALIQEGICAWHGDATSIVSQIIAAQSKARENKENIKMFDQLKAKWNEFVAWIQLKWNQIKALFGK